MTDKNPYAYNPERNKWLEWNAKHNKATQDRNDLNDINAVTLYLGELTKLVELDKRQPMKIKTHCKTLGLGTGDLRYLRRCGFFVGRYRGTLLSDKLIKLLEKVTAESQVSPLP